MPVLILDSMRDKIKCSTCGTNKSFVKDTRLKKQSWYRNQERGIGFWCKLCYNRYWKNKRKEEEEMKSGAIM